MPTPKFDFLSIELSKRIGDPITTADQDGVALSASARNSIINKALLELFKTYWKGNIDDFIGLFPELTVKRTITTNSNGLYTIASPNLDYFDFVSGLWGGHLRTNDVTPIIQRKPRSFYTAVKANFVKQLIPSPTNMFCFELGGVMEFLPSSSFNAQNADILIIKQPIDPTTGGFLTQGGTYDSPYYPIWHGEILSIAEQLFKTEAQETT